MKFDKNDLLLYAVTDRHWLGGRTLTEVVQESLDGGATLIQLREKNLSHDAFLKEALSLQALCKNRQIPLIINDDVNLALEINADGVHVGQSDMLANDVRKKIGSDKILGVSVQTVSQALQAEASGADYLGVGAVFPTGSKDDALEVSFEILRAICRAVRIPVVAIGGITKENMEQLEGSGIAGIAVISAIYAQSDIPSSTRQLYEKADRLFRNH